MRNHRDAQRSSQEREALLGLECALPSRELRLARTEPRVRRSLWRRALDWYRASGRTRHAQTN
jgi:hypothetical protein